MEWPGVVLLMAIESACIPFPSEIIMPLAGWILVKDRGHGYDYLFLAAFWGALGNMLGSQVAYAAGRLGGRPLLVKYGRYLLITPKEIEWSDRWFKKYGEITVFVTRLMPVVRTFISLPAGVARMNFWRFSALTLLGAYPWSLALVWAGYELGENWEDLKDWFRPVSIPIVLVILLGGGYLLYRRIREVMHAGSYERLLEEQQGEAAAESNPAASA